MTTENITYLTHNLIWIILFFFGCWQEVLGAKQQHNVPQQQDDKTNRSLGEIYIYIYIKRIICENYLPVDIKYENANRSILCRFANKPSRKDSKHVENQSKRASNIAVIRFGEQPRHFPYHLIANVEMWWYHLCASMKQQVQYHYFFDESNASVCSI